MRFLKPIFVLFLPTLGAIFPFMSAQALEPEATPTFMQKITVRASGSSITPGTFANQPRTYYRAGRSFCRVEEAPDNEASIQALLLVSAPDIWMINLASGKGKHIVDPHPPYTVKMPILPRKETLFQELEYGHELDFYLSHAVKPAVGEEINGKKSKVYKYSANNIETTLWVSQENIPLRLEVKNPEKGDSSYEYLEYVSEAFKSEKFSLPPGIEIIEANPTMLTDKAQLERKIPKEESEENGSKPLAKTEPEQALTEIRNEQDLHIWLTYYYLYPQSEFVIPAIKLMSKSGYFQSLGSSLPACAFLAKVFQANPEKIAPWVAQLSELDAKSQALFLPLILSWSNCPQGMEEAKKLKPATDGKYIEFENASLDPAKLDTFYISSPSNLDMFWGCFMATGDRRYVTKIITTLPWMRETNQTSEKYAIGASSAWSLCLNARQHKKVMQILKEECQTNLALQSKLKAIIQVAENTRK
jgi:hypothetical protein